MKRIWELISTASHSRTTALLVILVIGAAIPLTVLVAQKQQEVRQQASYCEGVTSQTYCTRDAGCKWTPLKIDDPAYAGPLGICSKDPSIFCNCDTASQTCILDGPGGTPKCFQKGIGTEGSYCGTPSKTDNNLFPNLPNKDACASGYCDFSLRCANPPGNTGGTGVTAQGGTSTGGTCAWGPWTDTFCGNGGIGIQCKATQMYQTRYGTGNCNYVGVGDQGGQRCLDNYSTCVSGGGSTIEQCNITHLGQNCKADPQASVCLNNLKGRSDCVSRYTAYRACITPNTGPGIIEEQANAFCGSGGVGGQPPPSAGESCGPTDNLRCSGSQVQQCQDDGIWKTVSDCASFGQVCKAITGTTVAACSLATPPTPACDTGIECTGACTAPSNTCGANNGTESGCEYTKLASGGTCTNAPAPPRACAIDKCVSPNTCTNGTCEPPAPNTATLAFTIGLNGIGSVGDSVNPGAGGNRNPKRKIREIEVFPISPNSDILLPGVGTKFNYESASGRFKGTATGVILSGTYDFKIRAPGFLAKKITGVQITPGQTIDVSAELVNGDVNDDDSLSVLDYNILLACWLKGASDSGCTGHSGNADLNDDGAVDQFDYNLWLREFKVVGLGGEE